jgi:ribosome-binding ATPase YchF (GTP1/OBG family)
MHSLYDQRDSGVVVSSNNSVDLDVRLIDEELLYADESEADKIMKKLKERMQRQKSLAEKEDKLSSLLKQESTEVDDSAQNIREKKAIKQNKTTESLRTEFQQMTSNQKLEFMQNLLNFANKINSESLVDNLVPALQLFAQENSDIKRALLS